MRYWKESDEKERRYDSIHAALELLPMYIV